MTVEKLVVCSETTTPAELAAPASWKAPAIAPRESASVTGKSGSVSPGPIAIWARCASYPLRWNATVRVPRMAPDSDQLPSASVCVDNDVPSMATSVPDRSDPPASRSALPVTVAGSGERTTGTTCATSCATIVTAPEALWYPGLSYATA